jgi:hypothetical protein
MAYYMLSIHPTIILDAIWKALPSSWIEISIVNGCRKLLVAFLCLYSRTTIRTHEDDRLGSNGFEAFLIWCGLLFHVQLLSLKFKSLNSPWQLWHYYIFSSSTFSVRGTYSHIFLRFSNFKTYCTAMVRFLQTAGWSPIDNMNRAKVCRLSTYNLYSSRP